MLRIGLTGSIGSGKSTTANTLREFGFPVHDADAAVHLLYRGKAVAPVEAEFPDVTREGVIDRALLGARVRAEPQGFERLERIVHPLVHEAEAQALASAAKAGHRAIILDIPLLFETGGEKRCDLVLVASVDAETQRARVLARPGMTETLFHAILARQMPDAEKRRRAHAIVDTGLGFAAARRDLAAFCRAIRPLMA